MGSRGRVGGSIATILIVVAITITTAIAITLVVATTAMGMVE